MRRAFTLLEVMVALAIFAFAAVVLGAGYVNVLNAYEQARRGNLYDQDVSFARAQLLAEPDHDKAEQGGDYDSLGGRHVSWHATIDATNTADLFLVTFVCDVTETSGGGVHTVTEHFNVDRPTWADPVVNSTLRQNAQNRIQALQGTNP
jgi:general secretion pathway protein I